MSEEGLMALLGVIEEPESEYYDEMGDLHEEGAPGIASKNYDFAEFLNSIGTREFKIMYMSIMNNVYSIDDRRNLAREVLEKIKEVYNIDLDFSHVPTMKEVAGIFKFLKFLEYEYINFISDVWKFMDIDLRSDIRDFCFNNGDKIIKIIDEQIETHFLPEIISNFLRTYNKEDMVSLFIEWTEKAKMMIFLRMREEELENGGS